MRLRLAGPWLAAAAGLTVMTSCNANGLERPGAARPDAGPSQVVQRPAPVRALPPVEFTLSGELTQGGWLKGIVPQGTAALALDGKDVRFDAAGRFIVAFDRDAGSSAQLVARLVDGRVAQRTLTIAPRAWKIEHVGVGPRPGGKPNPEWERRRAGELARINAARRIDSGSEGWRQPFIWPAKGRVSGMFGSQRIYNGTPGSYHSGTDIATGTSGTPFVAPADGVVILAAQIPFSLEGNLLMIDHGMGLNSAFLHCSAILVREGDSVKQGQVIGRIGATGRATGPHLHWSMKWRDTRLDPILFTGPMR